MKLLLLALAFCCTTALRAQSDTTALTDHQQGELLMEKSKTAKQSAFVLLAAGVICNVVASAELVTSLSGGLLIANATEREKADKAATTGLIFTVATFGFYTWSFFEFRKAKKLKSRAKGFLQPETVFLPASRGTSVRMWKAGVKINL